MIYTLWNNESIWSKVTDLRKDIAREIRDRRVEESNSLQAPIDQFLADNRQVRLQLQEAYSKGQATAERLYNISEQFKTIGLLEGEQLDTLIKSADKSTKEIESVDKKIEETDKQENKLQRKPKEVAIMRKIPLRPDMKLIEDDTKQGLFPLSKISKQIKQ